MNSRLREANPIHHNEARGPTPLLGHTNTNITAHQDDAARRGNSVQESGQVSRPHSQAETSTLAGPSEVEAKPSTTQATCQRCNTDPTSPSRTPPPPRRRRRSGQND